MNTREFLSILLSIGSAFISVLSVVIALYSLKRQRRMQGWITNHQLLSRSLEMLMADNTLVSIFGIDLDEMAKDGITPSELLFILNSLDASSAMYHISGEKQVILTEYRKNFLRSAKVRKAWKRYLRGKTFSTSPWTKAVDAYIDELESTGAVARL